MLELTSLNTTQIWAVIKYIMFSQMHMVHMSTKHASVATAIGDDIGLTVLGVMFEVRSVV